MRRTIMLVGGLLAIGVAHVAASPPAHAHDELLSSSPAAGERLEDAPDRISLEYSAEVLTVGGAVRVTDAADRDWAAGDVVFDGTRVTIDLQSGMPEAGYEVRWRVVSSDGHPISGRIPFTVGDSEPLPSAAQQPDVAASAEASDMGSDASSEQERSQALSPARTVLVGAGGALIAGAGYVLALTAIRRRTAGDS